MGEPLQQRVRFPVLLTVCTAAAFCVLVALGTWQVYRLHWKEGLIAAREAAMSAPPVSLSGAPGETLPEPFRHVRVSGRFLPGKALLVGPRSWNRESGFHLIQPLSTESGRTVLVNRGWVPYAARAQGRLPEAPEGRATVEGLLRVQDQRGWLTPENEPAKGVWFTIDPVAMARALGVSDVAPWWIAAGPEPEPRRPPIGGQGAQPLPNPHLQYAITWYAIAAALVVFYVLLMRQR